MSNKFEARASRKSVDSVESSPEKVFRDFLAGDFWKFIYVARNVSMKYPSFSSSVYDDLCILAEYVDEEYHDLRCALNAEFRRLNGLKYLYELNAMRQSEINAVRRLLYSACMYGYYPWDIMNACFTDKILSFYMDHDGVPLPPRPFGNSAEQQARAITFSLVVGSVYTGSADSADRYGKEKVKYVVEAVPGEEGFDVELKRIKFYRDANTHIAKMMHDGDPRSSDVIKAFLRDRKSVVSDSFSAKSNAARCIGLVMYEEMVKVGRVADDFVCTFKGTEMYDDLSREKIFRDSNSPYLSDKDDLTLKRWLQNTEKSVLTMSVSSFK
jgi:hypothetical protein